MQKIKNISKRKNKDGSVRFYWQPNNQYKKFGFTCHSLSSIEEIAEQQALELNQKLYQFIENTKFATRAETRKLARKGSFESLITEFKASRSWTKLADKTIKEYQTAFNFWMPYFKGYQVAAIQRKMIQKIYDTIVVKSAFVANSRIKVLKLLLNFAIRQEYINNNPLQLFETEKTSPRHEVWDDEAFSTFFYEARNYRKSIALALLLARCTGQRQGDVLSMKWSDIKNNHIRVKQNKTGVEVSILISDELAQYLEEARQNAHSIFIVESEETKKGYTSNNFLKHFKIAKKIVMSKNPTINFDNLKFIDLRRTYVTATVDAGATANQTMAITGHTSTKEFDRTYLQKTEKQADAAIIKMGAVLKAI